ncbi:MAG: hypothetical protein AABW83_00835 [Nanoarchaeota archaeon]
MELVALLGKGEGTWGQVAGVINKGDWEKIILIGDNFAKQFTTKKDFEFIEIKESSITDLKNEILEKLKNKINGTEAILSIASGEGKQHMALISALLSLPVGIRFVALTKDGLIFM